MTRLNVKWSREQKRLIRYKGCMLCEWCNRWSPVAPGYRWGQLATFGKSHHKKPKKNDPIGSFYSWEEFVDVHKIWYCNRPNCIASRP